MVGTADHDKLAKSLQLPQPVFSERRLAGVYGYGRLRVDNASHLRWKLVQFDSHALAAQQGAVLDSVVLQQRSHEPSRRARVTLHSGRRSAASALRASTQGGPGPSWPMAREMGLCVVGAHAGGSGVRCRGFGGGNVCGGEIVARVRPPPGISHQVARAHAPEHAAPGAVSQAEPSLPRRCSST